MRKQLLILSLMCLLLASLAAGAAFDMEKVVQQRKAQMHYSSRLQLNDGLPEEDLKKLETAKDAGKKHLMLLALDYEDSLEPMLQLACAASAAGDFVTSILVGRDQEEGLALLMDGMEGVILLPGGADTLESLHVSADERARLGSGRTNLIGFGVPNEYSGIVTLKTLKNLQDADLAPDMMIIDQWSWDGMQAARMLGVPYMVHVSSYLSVPDEPFASELTPVSVCIGDHHWLADGIMRLLRTASTRAVAGKYRIASNQRDVMLMTGIEGSWSTSSTVFADLVSGRVVLAASTYGMERLPLSHSLPSTVQLIGNALSEPSLLSERKQELAASAEGSALSALTADLSAVGRFVAKAPTILISIDDRPLTQDTLKQVAWIIHKIASAAPQAVVSVYREDSATMLRMQMEKEKDTVLLVQHRALSDADLLTLDFASFASSCSSASVAAGIVADVPVFCSPLVDAHAVYAAAAIQHGIAALADLTDLPKLMQRKPDGKERKAREMLLRSGGSSAALDIVRACLSDGGCEEYLEKRSLDLLEAAKEVGVADESHPVAFYYISVILPLALVIIGFLAIEKYILSPLLRSRGKGLINQNPELVALRKKAKERKSEKEKKEKNKKNKAEVKKEK